MICGFFSQIKDVVIRAIDNSVSEIDIAVAWFTQRDLFQAILNALNRQVKVNIILIDDIINCGPNGLEFDVLIKHGGKIRFMNTRKILMHNKFCIFDSKYLITGSYNWTYSAEIRNAENIIVTDDEKVCQDFVSHFEELWGKLNPIESFTKKDFQSIDSTEFLGGYDFLREEYDSMEKANVEKSCSTIDIENFRNNISITRLNTIITNVKRTKPVLKANIGMRCIIDGIENQTLNLVKQGQELPFTNNVGTQTVYDNQKTIICDVVYGNYNEADNNEPLFKIQLDNLPDGKAGDIKFQTRVTIDTNGYMSIEYVCTNTGDSKSKNYDVKEKINYL